MHRMDGQKESGVGGGFYTPVHGVQFIKLTRRR